MQEMYPKLLESPFFKTKNQNFICWIVELLKPIKYKKNEFIWEEDQRANYIVFITKGQVFLKTSNIYRENFDK